jgi:hypothetical protein
LKHVKEAVRILNLPAGEAQVCFLIRIYYATLLCLIKNTNLLLQDVWNRLRNPDRGASAAEEDILSPIGVFLLTLEEARAVASKRADVT